MFIFTRKPIGAQTAVERAFETLRKRHSIRTIELTLDPEVSLAGGALSIIADDSDYHRRRRGLMIYPNLELCSFGDKRIIIALGYKGGSYPGDQYRSDFLAVQLMWDETKYGDWSHHLPESGDIPLNELQRIARRIGDLNDWFRSSLLTVMSDGRLHIRNKILKASVEDQQERFIFEKKEKEAISLDGSRKSLGFAYAYHPKFADFLTKEIEECLSKTSQ